MLKTLEKSKKVGRGVGADGRGKGRGVKPIKGVQVVGPVHIPLCHCVPLLFVACDGSHPIPHLPGVILFEFPLQSIPVAVLSLCKLDF